MKLLIDANLSPRLVGRLAELFPGSAHVGEAIWDYARAQGFTIVTADSDFLDLAGSRGAPPKVVHLENGNYWTARVEGLLRRHVILIAELCQSSRVVLVIRNTE